MGRVGFLERVKPLILSRRETEIVESADNKVWWLQEEATAYGQKGDLKNGPKALA